MTPLAPVETRYIDIASPDWCWSRLADADEGRLSYSTSRGQVSLAVPYAVTNEQITIPMASFNDAGWLAVDSEATLEVIGTQSNLGWLVRATGIAHRAGLPSAWKRMNSRQCHPAAGSAWPPGGASEWLMLPEVRLRGYCEICITREPGGPGAHQGVGP